MIIKLYFCNTIIETATSNKLKQTIMTKVNFKGYKGYAGQYKDTNFIVWNGSFNSQGDWYIDITDSFIHFTERELSASFKTKKQAISHLQYLVNKG